MNRFLLACVFVFVTLAVAPAANAEAPPAPPFCGPTATTSHTNATPTPIADRAVTTSTLEVTGAGGYLTDVDLITEIHHTYNADLDVTLQSPAGTVVTITTDNGQDFDDEFAGTTFDDQANPAGQVPYITNTGVVSDTLATANGVITPLTPEEPLAAFHGENPNGTWTLTISDDNGDDVGTLQSWRLDIQSLPAAPPTSVTSQESAAVVAIADASVTTSTIDIAGTGAHVSDLDLWLDLSHEFHADLDITLTSPAGTVVTITTDNGNGFFDDLFAGTTFDDQADPGGQVPYAFNNGLVNDARWVTLAHVVTPLTPEEPLAAFDGENPNGTWTLTIRDDLRDDGGELRGWRLDLTTGACPPPHQDPKTGEQPPVATAEPAGGNPPVAAGGNGDATRLRVRAGRLSVFAGAAARCRGAQGTCRVRVVARRRVIARGTSDSARVPLRLTRAGQRLLEQRLGGARAKVVATDGDRRARTHTRAILAVERITTPPGSWLADRAQLTEAGSVFVRRLRARLFGVASLRCDGYAALPEGPPRQDFAAEISLARATMVCGRDAELLGHGSANPIAGNAGEAGRAANRRVEVTVRHR